MEHIKIKIKFKHIVIAALVVVAAIMLKCLFGYNSATQLLVKQSPTGTMSCVDHAGFYFKGFATIYSYDRTKDFYFNSSNEKVKGEGWEGGDDDEDDVSVTLSRNANADISGYLKYQIPTDCDDLVKIHKEQRSDKKRLMSARLKLKRINDRIQGVTKMAQKAQYERDEIHRRFIANTVTLGIETWKPIMPRGEVYSTQFTERGWKSFSNLHKL